MAPGLARDRRLKKGMFAPELSEASKKLTAMVTERTPPDRTRTYTSCACTRARSRTRRARTRTRTRIRSPTPAHAHARAHAHAHTCTPPSAAARAASPLLALTLDGGGGDAYGVRSMCSSTRASRRRSWIIVSAAAACAHHSIAPPRIASTPTSTPPHPSTTHAHNIPTCGAVAPCRPSRRPREHTLTLSRARCACVAGRMADSRGGSRGDRRAVLQTVLLSVARC
jgi:hypothetical protein